MYLLLRDKSFSPYITSDSKMSPIRVISYGWFESSKLVLREALEGSYSWPVESRFSFGGKKAVFGFVFLSGV